LHHTEGSGLGLALCKKIVENHFGTIAASSKLNEGTTITVILPLDATSA
jgi:signal transduction histidine kinase